MQADGSGISGGKWKALQHNFERCISGGPGSTVAVKNSGDTEPATLEDALRVATRLEAVRRTADDEYVDEVKKRKRNIRGATQAPEATDAQAERKIADLETAVDKYRKELDRMRLLTEQLQQRVAVAEQKGRTEVSRNQDIGDTGQEHWGGPPTWYGLDDQNPGAKGRSFHNRGSRPGRWTSGRMSRDECRKCGAHGHWWRDCPQSQQQSPGETPGGVCQKRHNTGSSYIFFYYFI